LEFSVPGTAFVAGVSVLLILLRANLLAAVLVALCFPSVAIATLPALGGASLTMPLLFSLIFIAYAFVYLKPFQFLTSAPGAIYYCFLAIYVVIGAFIFPRLFAGTLDVMTLVRGGVGLWMPLPLAPSNFNITQACYFVVDFLLFISVIAWLHDRPSFNLSTLDAFGFTLILCGLVELPSKLLGLGDPLAAVRTVNYALLTEVNVGGFVRLVGGFTEASGFGPALVIALTFSLFSYLMYPSRRQLVMSILLLTFALLCTSSAGYVSLIALFGLIFVFFMLQIITSRITTGSLALAGTGFGFVIVCLIIVISEMQIFDPFLDLLDTMIFNKATSDSAIERSEWNRVTLSGFVNTFGLGTGIGSSRSSGLVHAILGTLGVPGAVFFAGLLISLGVGVYHQRLFNSVSLRLFAVVVISLAPGLVTAGYAQLGALIAIFAGLCSAFLVRGSAAIAPAVRPQARMVVQH
jgi:hypothetical protein